MPPEPIDIIPPFAFWRDGIAAMTRNARALLQLAGEPVTFANVVRVVEGAPLDDDDLQDGSRWRAESYCNRCLAAAHARNPGDPACRARARYFLGYFLGLTRNAQHMLIDAFTGIGMGMEDETWARP